MIHPFSSKCNHSFQRLHGIPLRNFQPPGRTDRSKAARAPPGARAAHTRIKSGSEPPSAAAAAVISTAAAVPAAAGIPQPPPFPQQQQGDDNQHNDPQAASATPAIIAAPHIEVPLKYEDLRRQCAALKLSYVRGGKGLQIEAAEFHQDDRHLGPAGRSIPEVPSPDGTISPPTPPRRPRPGPSPPPGRRPHRWTGPPRRWVPASRYCRAKLWSITSSCCRVTLCSGRSSVPMPAVTPWA